MDTASDRYGLSELDNSTIDKRAISDADEQEKEAAEAGMCFAHGDMWTRLTVPFVAASEILEVGEDGKVRKRFVKMTWCAWLTIKWKIFKSKNRKARHLCRQFIKSQLFYWIVLLLVFLNTVVLTSEHYGQERWLDDFQGMTQYDLGH